MGTDLAILLETPIHEEWAVAFWKRHGYRIEAVLKRDNVGQLKGYEMREPSPDAASKQPAQKENQVTCL